MESNVEYQPCQGQEFKAIMATLAQHPLAAKLFPHLSAEALQQHFLAYDSIHSFQSDAMYRACQYLLQNTVATFTCTGQEHLDGHPSLFISNHRDIVVDSLLLQYQLITLGLDTTHIVIGSNLYEMPLMSQLAKVNKMIGIPRASGGKAFYNSMMQLSALLRSIVCGQGQSVWIAQRNGRTKNGIDQTEPALIKMIASTGSDPVTALHTMHIIPLSISYQWEPCAPQKARELCLRQQGPYAKTPGEDTQSILNGLTSFKGDIHLTVCPPLTLAELQATQGQPRAVARLIDSRIALGYHLFDNNTFADTLLNGNPLPDTPAAQQFLHHLDQACAQHPDLPNYRQTLLSIYAGPLHNR